VVGLFVTVAPPCRLMIALSPRLMAFCVAPASTVAPFCTLTVVMVVSLLPAPICVVYGLGAVLSQVIAELFRPWLMQLASAVFTTTNGLARMADEAMMRVATCFTNMSCIKC